MRTAAVGAALVATSFISDSVTIQWIGAAGALMFAGGLWAIAMPSNTDQ
jgi:hypothetical protein